MRPWQSVVEVPSIGRRWLVGEFNCAAGVGA